MSSHVKKAAKSALYWFWWGIAKLFGGIAVVARAISNFADKRITPAEGPPPQSQPEGKP